MATMLLSGNRHWDHLESRNSQVSHSVSTRSRSTTLSENGGEFEYMYVCTVVPTNKEQG